MQLACIVNNLEAQEWQKLDKFLEKHRRNCPKILSTSGKNALKWEKFRSFSAGGAAKFGQKMAKNQFHEWAKVGYFGHILWPSTLLVASFPQSAMISGAGGDVTNACIESNAGTGEQHVHSLFFFYSSSPLFFFLCFFPVISFSVR